MDDMMDQMMDDQANPEEDGDDAAGDVDGGEAQQVVKAIPTFIVGGTLQGGVFRVNLATCNITVEVLLLLLLLLLDAIALIASREPALLVGK